MASDGLIVSEKVSDIDSAMSYTSHKKLFCTIIFVTMGFLGSSCAGAITKNFGALSMSITSTARKAVTLFLSFLFFPKVCTFQHIFGMSIFVTALFLKSYMSQRASKKKDASLLPVHMSLSSSAESSHKQ